VTHGHGSWTKDVIQRPKELEGVKKQKTLQEDVRERATIRPYDAVSSAEEPEVLCFQDIYLHVLEC